MGFLNKILIIGIIIFSVRCRTPLIIQGKYERSNEGILSYGDSPGRNFYYHFALGDSLRTDWETELYGGFGSASAIAQNDKLFIADLGARVSMLDINSGKILGYETYKGEIAVTPVLQNRRIILGLNNISEKYSTVIFYDFIAGKVSKEIRVDGVISNEFIKLKDGFIVVLQNGKILEMTYYGNKIWETETNSLTRCNPAASDSIIVLANRKGEAITLDTNGKIIYRKKIGSAFESGISVENEKVFLGDIEGNIYCLDINDGEVLWRSQCESKIEILPVLDDKSLYIGDLAGNVYSFDKETGKKNWETETGGLIKTNGIVFDDFLVQPDFSGYLYLIDKSTGEIVKSFNYKNSVSLAPVFFDNRLFFGSYKGIVHCLIPEKNY